MRKGPVAFQIGKNGLTDNFIATLAKAFKNRKVLKVQILSSATEERANIKDIAAEMSKRLGGNYKCKIIGFTIIVRRTAKIAGEQDL